MSFSRIVLVDDDLAIRVSLSLLLEDAGYDVLVLDNAQTILGLIENGEIKTYDLIITDMKMPGMTGMMLIDCLIKRGVSIPVIVITGYSDKGMVMELLRKGVSGFLEKPFDQDSLLNTIDEVAKKIGLEQKKLKEEHVRMNLEVENYRDHFNALKTEMNAAVNVYRNLFHLESSEFNVNLSWKSRPHSELGGDFADLRNNEKGCDLFVADVAGHDIGASFHTILLKAFFDENCRSGQEGLFFFKRLNLQLLENGKNERMVTGQFARIDLKAMEVRMVSAAHPSPVIFDDSGELVEISGLQGDVLGLLDEVDFDVVTIPVKKGYRLYFYTDGIIETSYYNSEKRLKDRLRRDGLIELLKKNHSEVFPEVIEGVWKNLSEYANRQFQDDILLLGVEIP